ncbi:MAG: hypothetical protein WAV46_02940 [Candidatus Moraniibacteriota bacterium]
MKYQQFAILKGIMLFFILGITSLAAIAGDLMTWQPTTAAGGAFVPPGYWEAQAAYRMSGGGLLPGNITLAPSSPTFNDYSTKTVTGGETNVNAQPLLQNGGSVYVSTQHDPAFKDSAAQNNSSSAVSVDSSQGPGSSLTTSTSTNGPK